MTSGTKVLRGLFLLARGRAAGMADFANTSNSLTASMAPLIAFPLVGALLLLMKGDVTDALISFTAQLCVALAPSLITYEFARGWGREDVWLRTASALNWSFWIVLPLLMLAAMLGAMLVTLGVQNNIAEAIMITVMGAYIMWLHWFIVRTGLSIGVWQAILLVVITNIVIGLLALGPDLIDMAMGGKMTAFLPG
ncbi:MAG: hypothetical protein POG24_02645 [Acidocella sp.]|nr:hypothetical protein [Acidocella sp.]